MRRAVFLYHALLVVLLCLCVGMAAAGLYGLATLVPERAMGLSLLYVSTVIADLSVLAFAVLHRGWRKTGDGQHVMAYMVSLALILTVWSLGALFEVPPWWERVRLVAFMTLPVALSWRLVLIVQSWWQRRHPRS